MTRSTRPSFVAGALAAALLTLAVAPVVGAGPTKEPFVFDPFTLDGVCPFPVHLEAVSNKAHTKVFADGDGNVIRILVNGKIRLRLTNEASGTSIVVNSSGPVTQVPIATGEVWVQRGVALWWAFPGEPSGPDLWLSVGRMEVEFDANFALVSIQRSHRDRLLCQELNG